MPVEKQPRRTTTMKVTDIPHEDGYVTLGVHKGKVYKESKDEINRRLGVDPTKDYAEAVFWETGDPVQDNNIRNRYLSLGYTLKENENGSKSFIIPKTKRDAMLAEAEANATRFTMRKIAGTEFGNTPTEKLRAIEEAEAPVDVQTLLSGG